MQLFRVALAVCLVAPAATAAAQEISDPQIASIVVTANQVDIDAGKLAADHASNAEVKRFGQQMVEQHTAVNKQAGDLAGRLKLTPEDNAVTQSLKSAGAGNMQQLKGMKGAAFDRAYVEHEVAYHQQVLDAIDKTLIPAASNTELKALLTKVRPAIAAHLEHAKALQASLK